MNIEVTEAQERHFYANGEILFEDVLTAAEKELLLNQKEGIDLWRKNERLKKLALSKTIGSIAGALTQKRPIRLLIDYLGTKPVDLPTHPYQGALIAFSFDLTTLSEKFHLSQVTPVNPTYIIVYGEDTCRYRETKEPFPLPKRLGLGYGDRLPLKDFPYLIK